MINSIKFYYEVVKEMPNRFYRVERPKKVHTLPKVLAKSEVKDIIEATTTIKHRCILSLMYSSGLRMSELLNLKPEDIDSKRMMVRVNQGKDRRDRLTLLSEKVLQDLRQYYIEKSPKNWLFESYIQTLPGHRSSKTTEIYTHVATNTFILIKNPLD